VVDEDHDVRGGSDRDLESVRMFLSSSTSAEALAGEMRWFGVMEAFGGIPDTILRFFPSPGNEVTLNGPRSLRSLGMVHTTLPFKGGSGEEGGGEEGEGRGLAGGLVGRGVVETFESEEGRKVTTTVSVTVSGGRGMETVTVDAS
jgi:hypothetical protein